MNLRFLYMCCLTLCVSASSKAQNSWTQCASFGGSARYSAFGFAIGNKGYIGTGQDNNFNYVNDFWEYDPATNVWTQKANFGGTGRQFAVGFAIGNKGYIGTGFDSTNVRKRDFWEYDPATNVWTQKANFGGGLRSNAVGFSIGNKGYIGTGVDDTGYKKDFWEYDPATNAWVQKADFGGSARGFAVGFAMATKGYIGTGYDASAVHYRNDFWEYDPATNIWVQKANFGGSARQLATGFALNNKGYIGTGVDGQSYKNDFWEYDPATNAWTQKTSVGSALRIQAVGFAIGNRGYIGTGGDGFTANTDFLSYTPGSCTPPNAVLSGTTTNCGSVTLTASGGVSYRWSGGSAPTAATNTFTSSGNYNVTVTGSNGCTVVLSPTVTVNPTATATITGATTGCGSTSLTASGGVTYRWSGGSTPTAATNTFTSSGVYGVTVTNAFGCSASASRVVALTTRQQLSVNIDQLITASCVGDSATLRATGTSFGTSPQFQWYENDIPIGGNTANCRVKVSNQTMIYRVRVTSSETCINVSQLTSAPYTPPVRLRQYMQVGIARNKDTIVEGNSITFTASVQNGGSVLDYQWLRSGLLIPGGTGSTLTLTDLKHKEPIACRVTSYDVCTIVSPVTSAIDSGVVVKKRPNSVSEQAFQAMADVFPNPFGYEVWLRAKKDIFWPVKLVVTDVQGRIWWSETAVLSKDAVSIGLGAAPPGWYILSIYTDKEVLNTKILKQ